MILIEVKVMFLFMKIFYFICLIFEKVGFIKRNPIGKAVRVVLETNPFVLNTGKLF
jgi:hypothetical protein